MSIRRAWRRAVSPLSWSIRTRRMFMLVLPLSILLWIGWLTALVLAMMLRSVWKPLSTFWQAPPRPLRHSSYYGSNFAPSGQPRKFSLVDRDAA